MPSHTKLFHTHGATLLCKERLQGTIVCDGCSLPVSQNLLRNLNRLRQSLSSTVLWVDAICIDQGENAEALKERAQQVSIMNRIFSSASLVVIDLGPTEQDFTHLLRYLDHYATFSPDAKTLMPLDEIKLPGLQTTEFADLQLWKELLSLLRLPWFGRLWCFQEFVLAKRSITLVGSRYISHFNLYLGLMRALDRFEQAFVSTNMTSIFVEVGMQQEQFRRYVSSNVRRITTWSIYQQTGQNEVLEPLLTVGRYLQVSDPRDKIYAVNALFPSNIIQGFQIDYTEAFHQLQMRFSLQLILKKYGIWVLMYAIGPNNDSPSWVLSLAAADMQYPGQTRLALCANSMDDFKYDFEQQEFFKAGGSASCDLRVERVLKCLVVKGCMFDSIKTVSKPFLPNPKSEPSEAGYMYVVWMSQLFQWAGENNVHDEILWRVLYFDGYGEVRVSEKYRTKSARDAAFRTSYNSVKSYVLNWTRFSNKSLVGKLLSGLKSSLLGSEIEKHVAGTRLMNQQVQMCMPNMRVVVTARGHIAAVPAQAQVGDRVAVFVGIPAPFVLREKKKNGRFQVIGSCYVYGLMDGQVLKHNDWKEGIIHLV